LKLVVVTAVSLLAGCPAPEPKKPDPPPVDTKKMAELGLLMKNDINPAFSKLSFLVLHGDGEDTDRAKLKAEIQTSAATLRKGIGRLREWKHPPTVSQQGRDVFFAFATSIDNSLTHFEDAITRDDAKAVISSLETITKTCENCHHFFRVDVPAQADAGKATSPVDPK
jgi:hypothetical protein